MNIEYKMEYINQNKIKCKEYEFAKTRNIFMIN